ncbi:uncharacterized protein K452DRAFT_117706 [Aplosporella prunicola CBS 121167]|uniref:Uncharacterized protein n=1 Tax=Aplosporella prunicola CBS 121167 TaxID=1176127 RepID=A0A6A6B0L1_9PEZI|nr:uncharacterized protein K452DRAFT_117706 [Aplosporella prunicola CBS 121167]KAF2136754.1 hypothetical protein K452DRAFT_117706 [Aplosporella prunicola CBS 121167]
MVVLHAPTRLSRLEPEVRSDASSRKSLVDKEWCSRLRVRPSRGVARPRDSRQPLAARDTAKHPPRGLGRTLSFDM